MSNRRSRAIASRIKHQRKRIERCGSCGKQNPTYSEQAFADGTRHIRVDCGSCGKYIKFIAPKRVPDPARAKLSIEQLQQVIPYPLHRSEFEIQAELFFELRRLGYDVRGEVVTRQRKNRFDIVIYHGKCPVAIIEVKPDKIRDSHARQMDRYMEFGVQVFVIRGHQAMLDFVAAIGEKVPLPN